MNQAKADFFALITFLPQLVLNGTDAVELNSRLRDIWSEHPGFELVDFSRGIESAVAQVAGYFQVIFESEIERKFRLDGVPSRIHFQTVLPVEQTQFYLIAKPELEYRFRRSIPEGLAAEYSATFKGKGTLLREEREQPDWPPAAAFESCLATNSYVGHVIKKTRHISVPKAGDLIFEIDRYLEPEPKWITEVTFDTVQAAESFQLPEWMAGAWEVTDNPAYKAKNVALNGGFPLVGISY